MTRTGSTPHYKAELMPAKWLIIPFLAWVAASLASVPMETRGDVLLLEAIEEETGVAERPTRGATMPEITERYGEPQRRGETVGDPPITRWDYDGFSIYFEHDRVLHTVPRRQPD